MGLDHFWQIGAVEYSVGPAVIGDITQSAVRLNTETTREVTGGNVYPHSSFLKRLKPVGSFTTKNLRAALTLCGSTGFCWASPNLLNLYLVKRACAGNAAGSVHKKYSLIGGVLVPRQLTLSDDDDATLTLEAFAVTDSSGNAAVIKTDASALPTGFTEGLRYCIGSANSVAAAVISGIKRVVVDYGINVENISSDSDIYPTFVGVNGQLAKVTMTGLDAEWAEGTATGTVELNGTACTQANTFWFAKRRGFADNTANHIKISTAGTAYVDDYFDGSGTAPAQTAIMVESIYDGTNAPITHVIDTAHPA